MNTSLWPSSVFQLRGTRRRFLQGASLALAAGIPGCCNRRGHPLPGWIDAHVHVWTPDLASYPIQAPYRPSDMLPSSFTPDQLLSHTQPNGVGRVVLIQMSFYRFDNRYLLAVIRDYPAMFSGVAVVNEGAPGLHQVVRELTSSGVRGFRIHPEQTDLGGWLGSEGMRALWTISADEGLAVCPLVGPDALPHLDAMCDRFPRTRVVIDHFARIGVDGQIRQQSLDALCRLARHRHVYVKTSAFYALGGKHPPYQDLAPMIRRVRDAFGAKRLMWGSDCPYQVDPGHTYTDSIALIRDRLEFLTAEDRRWMLQGTAEKVFFG